MLLKNHKDLYMFLSKIEDKREMAPAFLSLLETNKLDKKTEDQFINFLVKIIKQVNLQTEQKEKLNHLSSQK